MSDILFTGNHDEPYLNAAMDNVLSWRLGEAWWKAGETCAGDYIDRGLTLCRELRAAGFLIVTEKSPRETAA